MWQGFGRVMGIDFSSPFIDWEEVVLGQKSWGVSSNRQAKKVKSPEMDSIGNGGANSKAIVK